MVIKFPHIIFDNDSLSNFGFVDAVGGTDYAYEQRGNLIRVGACAIVDGCSLVLNL